MKKLLYSLSFVALAANGQQTITSDQNGLASSPFTWDCNCIPTPDDDIIINHAVTMNVDWLVNSGGSITVNASGSFLQNGSYDLLFDGVGTEFNNYSNSSITNVAYTNGAQGYSTGHYSVHQGLYVGLNSNFTNQGIMDGIDSLLTEGFFDNSGTIYLGNFLNTGSFMNDGPFHADSVGNTGTFSSNGGYLYMNAFGNTGVFNVYNGFMDVAQDFYNIGDYSLSTGIDLVVHNDFYNGDTIGGVADFLNLGVVQVANDFFNGYNLSGFGQFCISNNTYNIGDMSGTFDFCDNTGGSIDFNTGTVGGSITFCAFTCNVGLNEENSIETTLFPNPSNGIVTVNELNYDHFSVFDLTGKVIETGTLLTNKLDLSHLENGTYFIRMSKDNLQEIFHLIIEK